MERGNGGTPFPRRNLDTMTTLRTRRIARALAAFWTAGLLQSGIAAWAAPQNQTVNLGQATFRTLLLFPVDVPNTVPGTEDVRTLLTDIARARLIASNAYAVTQFATLLAPVARLHNDQQLSDNDIKPPFAETNTKALKIIRLAGYDLAFVGSVDDYSYSDANKQATITLSGRILEASTGKILKSATLQGQSATGGTAKQEERAAEAARNAGEKLMTQLVPTIVVNEQPTVPRPPKRSTQPSGNRRHSRNDWLWGVLAVGLGLGIGLSSGGGGGGGTVGGGGGGPDTPPAPPRSVHRK